MPGHEIFGKDELQAINDWFVKSNGVMFAHGFDKKRNGIFKVREFEKEFAKRMGVKYAQAVSSGSSALYVALKSLGVKNGDEVITTPFTFIATIEAIIMTGATPVLCEIDETLNIDVSKIERLINKNTKCILPVHMAGTAANMNDIMILAKKYNLKVLEDTAQAIGGKLCDKFLGTIGDAGIFSFDFAKSMTTGEGGMIVTNDFETYQKVRSFQDHGHDYDLTVPRGKDTHKIINCPAFNFRMTEIQAVIGLVQLSKIESIISKQNQNKKMIKDALDGNGFKFRKIIEGCYDAGDSIMFFVENKEVAKIWADKLIQNEIGTKNLPDAYLWHFAGNWDHCFSTEERKLPISTEILEKTVAIPININMNVENIITVLKNLKKEIG